MYIYVLFLVVNTLRLQHAWDTICVSFCFNVRKKHLCRRCTLKLTELCMKLFTSLLYECIQYALAEKSTVYRNLRSNWLNCIHKPHLHICFNKLVLHIYHQLFLFISGIYCRLCKEIVKVWWQDATLFCLFSIFFF